MTFLEREAEGIIMETLTRGDVRLVYEEAGQGEPAMVFVHGWSCNRAFFAPQLQHFSKRQRCVGVDLRGHGESDKPAQDYTMEGFADDLVWIFEQLGLDRPVVVGHSMGGTVSLALAARHPEQVRAIVMVDGGTRNLADPDPAFAERARGLAGPDYQAAARKSINAMFLPGDDPARCDWVMEQMLATPRHVMLSATEGSGRFDMVAAASSCKVPALYIQAGRPKPELVRFQQLCPQLVLGRTVGSGHFNQLEVPDQVNAMIERFLALA